MVSKYYQYLVLEVRRDEEETECNRTLNRRHMREHWRFDTFAGVRGIPGGGFREGGVWEDWVAGNTVSRNGVNDTLTERTDEYENHGSMAYDVCTDLRQFCTDNHLLDWK